MNEILLRFFRISWISYKSLYNTVDIKTFILIKLLNPLMQLTFFSLLAGFVYSTDNISPWVISNSLLLCANNAFFGVSNIMRTERSFGTLMPIFATSLNKFSLFFSKTFLYILDSALTVIIGFIYGMLFFNVHFETKEILILLLVILVTIFSCLGLGMLVGNFGLLISDINMICNVGFFGILLFSGSQFSIAKLPLFIRWIPYFTPSYRGIEATRLLNKGIINLEVIYLIVGELILGIIYFGISYFVLKRLERTAQKRGTLDLM